LREDDALRSEEDGGRWAYAAAKVACERMIDAAGMGSVHLRFFNVVGPGQDSAGGMVLPTFVEHALAGLPIPVHGDGRSVRTFAHVDEVARTLCELVERDVPGGALNVGGRARASVMELAECVLALSGSRAGIVRVDPRRVVGPAFEDVAWREPDLSRLSGLGVYVPSLSLEAIVADTLERHERMRRRGACVSRAS
jgi:nucleoside-diphosphate-sugar epimerase